MVRTGSPTERFSEQLAIGERRAGTGVLGNAMTVVQRMLAPLTIIAIWQALASTGAISTQVLPSPTQVISAGISLAATGELQQGMLVSLTRASTGLALGIATGTVLGLIAGLSRIGENIVDTPVQMFRAIPVLALVPLFILWFGIGELSKILMIALATTFPIYINLHAGIRGIDQRYFELARTTGLSRWQVVREVLLPGSLAGWLVGLRYSSGLAWLVLVVSEQVNATSGLGYLMMDARQFFRTDIVILGIVLYGLLGIVTDLGVKGLERRLLEWQDPRRHE